MRVPIGNGGGGTGGRVVMFESISHPKQRQFLVAYAECGVIREAAQLCEISRESHYDWMREPEYAEAYILARELAADALEDEARMRANDRLRKSDRLLLRLLETLRPNVWGKHVQHDHQHEHHHTVDFSTFTDEELTVLEQLALKAGTAEPRRHTGGTLTPIRAEAGADVSSDRPTEPGEVPEAA